MKRSRAPQADGYTLLMATASTIATNPLISKVPWDPVKSFTPVSMLVVDPMPLILNPSVPANNVKELVALAKSKPGELTMASFGIGSVPHLAGELFNIVAGTKMLHVPYKGGAQALNDVIGGHVSLMFNSVGAVAGPIASGKVKLIADRRRQAQPWACRRPRPSRSRAFRTSRHPHGSAFMVLPTCRSPSSIASRRR